MKKKYFVILTAWILCLPLSSCAKDRDPDPPIEENADATVSESDNTENEEAGNESVIQETDPDDGAVMHRIGSCVFYTEHDLREWMDGDVFDFYAMADSFGWTGRNEYLSEDDVCRAENGEDLVFYRSSTALEDSYAPPGIELNMASFSFNGDEICIWFDEKTDNIIHTANGKRVPYALCELYLYAMEQVSYGDVSAAAIAVGSLRDDLPDYIHITTRY